MMVNPGVEDCMDEQEEKRNAKCTTEQLVLPIQLTGRRFRYDDLTMDRFESL
jgi:hypothetical protein